MEHSTLGSTLPDGRKWRGIAEREPSTLHHKAGITVEVNPDDTDQTIAQRGLTEFMKLHPDVDPDLMVCVVDRRSSPLDRIASVGRSIIWRECPDVDEPTIPPKKQTARVSLIEER